ncbi:uncharacterized protein K02A2.6-like [Cydia fagiglandana]|uniref:uncharacterized protein K02A2.6-like n=1 Tax=Cydia fagiglandana TaxID=1458189 RepID=UPI002FEE3EF6
MLTAGVITPVDHSDWATPLVVAHKADGAIRLCADYKVTLNKVLMVDRYPVPRIDDLLSNISGYKYFSKLDLSQAYNQILLDDTARYTVVNTHRGLFQYNRLVYGLSSSPGIFQRIMLNLFKNMPHVIVFLDDILITSKTIQEHNQHIQEVLHILQSNGLKVRKDKCEFFVDEVKYLGFIINKDGVRVDTDKVAPIIRMSPPTNVSELRSFLGMVNFYGKFIKHLSDILVPLYELLRKGKHWMWGGRQNDSFIRVKKALCSVEALVHYDMRLPCLVTCDASGHGIAAVLAQSSGDGVERAVAYASRALTAAEMHYSQVHKEALAIVFAIKKFHQYLYGRNFVLRTDHKPLVTIFGPNCGVPTAAASRLQRWAILLSAYDFTIEYVRTDQNTADALSRMIQGHRDNGVLERDEVPEQTYLHFASDAMLLDYKLLRNETSKDILLSRVLNYLKDGWPLEVEVKELKPFLNRKSELYEELGCIMWGHRVVIPEACKEKVLRELHEPHMGIVKTKALARSYVWWPGIDEAVERVCRACAVCAAVADAPPAHEPRLWPWPERSWVRLHADFLGPLAGTKYLIVVDPHSKWIEAIKMSGTSASYVIDVFREMWARFGLPKQLVTDNGPPFTSTEFQGFLTSNGVEHIFTAPYHPASNGACESAVKICKKVMKKSMEQGTNMHTALCRFLLNYHNTPHYATGYPPAKLLLGRSLRARLDCLKPELTSRAHEHQDRIRKQAKGVQRSFQVGDLIWYRKFGTNKTKWCPGRIVECLGGTNYSVKEESGAETVHRHVDQIRSRVIDQAGQSNPFKNLHETPQHRSLAYPLPSPGPAVGTEVNDDDDAAAGNAQAAPVETQPNITRNPPAAGQATPELLVANRPKRTRFPPVRYGLEID